MLTDLGVVTLTIAAASSAGHDDDAAALRAALVGGSGFLFGGPIVHAAHGHWAKAGYSLALRAGLALVGAGIGGAYGESACGQYQFDHEGCSIGYGAFGLFVGAATAMVADAAIFGREPVTDRASNSSVAFTPLRDGAALSLVGRF